MIEKFVANFPPARSLSEMRMLRLLVRFFSRHGFRVLQATDGEQALEIYRREAREIDAVLLDSSTSQKDRRSGVSRNEDCEPRC